MPTCSSIGDSERGTELRREVGVAIGDPFVYAEVGGRRVAIVWSIEGERIAAVEPGIETVPSESFTVEDLLNEVEDVYEIWPAQCVRYVRSLGQRPRHRHGPRRQRRGRPCDFFPRHVESACFGDMTRTFRVGAPDETITAWHRDCLEALELAISLVRPGA